MSKWRHTVTMDKASRTRSRFSWLWLLLAYASLGAGIVGLFVPVLPTVPFVLLSAYAAARGSQRLHAWLLAHPQFGPAIRDWEQRGAVSRRAKWLASCMMSLSALVLFAWVRPIWIAGLASLVMLSVAVWLWLRPEPV